MRSAQLFRNENFARLLTFLWDSPRSQKFGKNLLDRPKQESLTVDPYEESSSSLKCDQQVKVTVIGAAGRVGQTLSLLLKTCPLIDHLCLFDIDKSIKGIGVDIGHIDTKCCVSYVCGMRNIQQALREPDVVIIAAGSPASPSLSGKKLFDKNAPIVAGLSEACARFCPKACIVLITNPINSLLPVMGEVYQIITQQIPSKRMFGLTTLDVVRASTFVAEVIRKDPNNVIVPVIGGTSQETIVPVISQMKPCCKIKRGEMIALTECIKRAEDNLADCQNCGTRGSSTLSTAYAGFRFTSSLISALRGADNIVECAFVKSNILPELEYLASPVKLGVEGIEYNFGYPPLSDYELAGLEQSVAILQSDIKMGKLFVADVEESVQKGFVSKRLSLNQAKPLEPTPEGNFAVKKIQEGKVEIKKPQMVKERKKETKKQESNLEPTSLTQEVYSEGVRNWAVQASLKKLFKGQETDCEEIVRDSDPSELDSGSCKGESSLHKSNPLEELLGEKPPEASARTFTKPLKSSSLLKCDKSFLSVRGFHTSPTQLKNKYETYLMEDRQRTVVNIGNVKAAIPLPEIVKSENNYKRTSRILKTKLNIFKKLNVSAKQKYRSYNVMKKVEPNSLVVIGRGKKPHTDSETFVQAPDANQEEEKVENIEENAKTSESDPVIEVNETEVEYESEDLSKYRKIILEELHQLKKENDNLKKQISVLSSDKIMSMALEVENHGLELEKTKLKAGRLVMTSTMDAFTNFCKKLLTKIDKQVENERKESKMQEEEFEDTLRNQETSQEQKQSGSDEKYSKFLEKLMENEKGTSLENELKQNRVK